MHYSYLRKKRKRKVEKRISSSPTDESPPKSRTLSQTKFPPGWDEEKVRKILRYYEEQTEDEAVAEDETAFESRDQTMMEVPNDLVPAVRELIAQHQAQT